VPLDATQGATDWQRLTEYASRGIGDSMSMADNTRKRTDYLSDSDTSKAKDPAGDPLAELARLIGQGDPFAEQGLRKPAPLRADERPAAPEWLARPPAAHDRDEHDYEPQPAPRNDHAPEADYQAELPYEETGHDQQPSQRPLPSLFSIEARQDGRQDPHHDQDDRYQHDATAHAAYRAGDAAHEAEYQEAYQGDDRYRVSPPPAGDYDPDSYYTEDGHMPPQGEQHAGGGRRRGGILTIAAVLGLAVIGTAGAFGYRAFTSGSSGPTNPPVIKADTTPAKIVPPAPANADASGKPFQDRVGAAPAPERVVSREEQPVSLPVTPQRAVPPAPPTQQAGPAPLPVPPSVSATGEPKRVKTVTIRPDGAETTSAFPSAPPPSAPSGSATRSVAPKQQSQPSQQGGSAPMAIAPQADPSSRTKVASRPTQTQAAPAGGGYVVQVSAQKTEAEAQSSYRAMQTKYPTVLAGRDASIRRVELGGSGVWYRAQVGSFASASQAEEFCGRLKSAGGQCIVQRN
jgi:hypothetical protein